ncbi:MAG: LysM peptidoglycan-binding domain-containing protein, partial [Chloroflexi bacterium]|nr:LysM peptidoglycan-binding domain-containing protein [Chloroflexota bacterium]
VGITDPLARVVRSGSGQFGTRPSNYTVQRGDTFSSIADDFELPDQDLISENEGVPRLSTGMNIKIPTRNPFFGATSGTQDESAVTLDSITASNPLLQPPEPIVPQGGDSQRVENIRNDYNQSVIRYGEELSEGRVGVGRDSTQFQGVQATGTHYDASGRLVDNFGREVAANIIGENTYANLFKNVTEQSQALGVRPDYFASVLPAALPPSIASRMFDLDMSDPNSLNNDMSIYGYKFNPQSGLYEQSIEMQSQPDATQSIDSISPYGKWNWNTRKPKPKPNVAGGIGSGSVSIQMLNWRIATG